jgi:HD-GYP domain-containing protein (c-di-GMP phosphodiesterase class II)
MIGCDHSAPHSGVSRYLPGAAKLHLALVCDRCGAELGEFGTIDYAPRARGAGAELAASTARQLGLDEHRAQRLRFAMLMCDVGRDRIAAEIFDKPGPLTEAEWAQVRRQPELGAEVLADPSLADVREWILCRRERPDGLGYPRGLRRDQVSLEARILSVVEAYSAMMSRRPYRPAMHRALALRELLDNAGSQFDAAVVTAFVRARPRAQTPSHARAA